MYKMYKIYIALYQAISAYVLCIILGIFDIILNTLPWGQPFGGS
jgi:Mg2+/citrate symporter